MRDETVETPTGPVLVEPYVRAWELEGPRQRMTVRCFRAIRMSRVKEVVNDKYRRAA